MRRSVEPRVRLQGEVRFEASGSQPLRAKIVNVSLGGICARGVLPAGWGRTGDHQLRDMTVQLSDGAPPLVTRARVAWVRDEARSFGLCFGELGREERDRLSAVVDGKPGEDQTAAQRPVRLRLEGGPVLRAAAESTDEHAVIVCAELPWLRLGGSASCELDGQEQCGHIESVEMDVSPSGAARLRIRVAFEPAGRVRRDSTLPYFSRKVGVPVAASEELAVPVPAEETPPKSAMLRVNALVRLGEKRRVRMGLLRAAIALLTISALLLLVRALRSSESGPSTEAAPARPPEPPSAAATIEAAQPVPTPEPTPEPKAEPTPEPKAEPTPEPKAKLAASARPEMNAAPKAPARPRPRSKRPRASSRGR